ncbi:MAG: MarR family winged helix-turn-helix transcriptional regulator [Caulobacteraceae bacterium]
MSTADSFADTHLVRDQCLCLRAQRAARTLARRFDAALRPLDLTSGQFSLLNALNRPLAPGVSEVAALLGADRTTLTAALKPLIRRGLVAADVDDADRRSRRVALTAEGQALLARALPIWRACHEDLESRIGEEAADGLRVGLDALAGRPDIGNSRRVAHMRRDDRRSLFDEDPDPRGQPAARRAPRRP